MFHIYTMLNTVKEICMNNPIINLFLKINNSLNIKRYYLFYSIIIFLPVFLYGTFIQDDFSVKDQYFLNDILYSIKSMCIVNHNRPLSCVYHGLLTRFYPSFKLYFFIVFILYFLSVIILMKVFNFMTTNLSQKKLFFSLLIIPFFSYTILYSPAMQSMGVFAFLTWTISLFLQKKFLDKNKIIFLIASYFFIFFSLLIYESSFPLFWLSILFPLIYIKRENFNYKKFIFLNLIFIIFICLFVLFLQKNMFDMYSGNYSGENVSRVKLGILDLNSIIYKLLINLFLTFNILIHSFELFYHNISSIINDLNYTLAIQIFIAFLFVYLNLPKTFNHNYYLFKKEIPKYFTIYFLLILLGIILLNALMHALANTGLEFIRYNNRALVSLSFVFSIMGYLIVTTSFSKNNYFFFKYIFLIIFIIFLVNFLTFQNNTIKEKFRGIDISNKIDDFQVDRSFDDYAHKDSILSVRHFNSHNTLKTKKVFFLIEENLDKSKIVASYDTHDHLKEIFFLKNTHIIKLSAEKVCNKNYFNLYIKDFIDQKYIKATLIYDVNKKQISQKRIKPDKYIMYFNDYFKCLDTNDSIGFPYDSFLVKILKENF